MIPKPKHNIYLKTIDENYIKIAWIKNFKDFELMIGFYGLKDDEPSLAYEYEDRIVTSGELLNLKIPHKEAIIKGNIPIDHFTFHRNQVGKLGRFHLRYGANPKHIVKFKGNIHANCSVILDFFIVSELISKYKKSPNKPDSDDIIFNVDTECIAAIRAQYSGIDFDLESTLKEQAQIQGQLYVNAIAYAENKLKGYFTCTTVSEEKIHENKNYGTYFIISFQIDQDKYLLKTFIFN